MSSRVRNCRTDADLKDANAIANENYDNSLLKTVPSFNSFDPLLLGESTARLHIGTPEGPMNIFMCDTLIHNFELHVSTGHATLS
jgi:hypothetical protein